MPASITLPCRLCVYTALLGALCISAAQADDADIVQTLKEKGAKVTETRGVVTSLTISDGARLTDADFQLIGKLVHLKMLSLSSCLNDARLAQLTGLKELEYLQTNLAQVTDDGLKPLAQLAKLRNLKLFHPGKAFTGKGLAHLADMPSLTQLTVAGSFAFNDEGMAAVARLPHLQEFRMWHAGPTDEGIKSLKGLKTLKSLNIGQRLTYKQPACPSDRTLARLAELSTLESLQITEARLTLPALQQLKRLPALKKLTLGGIDTPAADIDRLKKDMPQVQIQWTAPTERDLRRIRALFGAE